MDSNYVFKDKDLARSISYARGCTLIEAEEFLSAFKEIVADIVLKGGKVNLGSMFTLQVIDLRNGKYRLKLKISDTFRKRIRENSAEVAYEKRRLTGIGRTGKEFLQDR